MKKINLSEHIIVYDFSWLYGEDNEEEEPAVAAPVVQDEAAVVKGNIMLMSPLVR